jgi:hypothetical protein
VIVIRPLLHAGPAAIDIDAKAVPSVSLEQTLVDALTGILASIDLLDDE